MAYLQNDNGLDLHAYEVLMQAQHCWENLRKFREDRRRNMDYTYGDQWNDPVKDEHGRQVRERDMIMRNGGIAITNNMIRKLVNTVKGLYIKQNAEPICTARDKDEQPMVDCLSELLNYVEDINEADTFNADLFEEFLVSGFAGCRKSYGWQDDRIDCWTTAVQPDYFFVDTNMRDNRGWDCTLVGEIHDMSWGDLLQAFSKSQKDIDRLRQIYHYASDKNYLTENVRQFGSSQRLSVSFLMPETVGACRVIEVWNKERKPRYHCIDHLNGDLFKCEVKDKKELVDDVNEQRRQEARAMGVADEEIETKLITAEWFVDNYWYFRFYAPTGQVLQEGETPYEHGSHPFVFRFYPFINAEIHSFVADTIDAQRSINRLVNLNDFLLRNGAKGLLTVPDQILEASGLRAEDIADIWAKPGGVLVYHQKEGVELPQQITNATQNAGITDLIQLEKGFFDDLTGANAALQGKDMGDISGTYYAQQAQNAATSLQGTLLSFDAFIKAGALKDCKNIQQFYDTDRIVNIVGVDGSKVTFNPSKVKDIEFDVNISEGQASPLYAQLANDFIMKIWQAGQCSLNTMLEVGDFPKGKKLLAAVQAEQQQAQQQAMEQQHLAMQQLAAQGTQQPQEQEQQQLTA